MALTYRERARYARNALLIVDAARRLRRNSCLSWCARIACIEKGGELASKQSQERVHRGLTRNKTWPKSFRAALRARSRMENCAMTQFSCVTGRWEKRRRSTNLVVLQQHLGAADEVLVWQQESTILLQQVFHQPPVMLNSDQFVVVGVRLTTATLRAAAYCYWRRVRACSRRRSQHTP